MSTKIEKERLAKTIKVARTKQTDVVKGFSLNKLTPCAKRLFFFFLLKESVANVHSHSLL